MTLQPLTMEGAILVLPLREKYAAGLRTNHPVTKDDQEEWYYQVTRRGSAARWWDVVVDKEIIGYCGIEHIDWIARGGELSILIEGTDEQWAHVFDHLLNKAFNELNLKEAHAEVYDCSPDIARWLKIAEVFGAYSVTLPMRKYHDGQLYDANYISWRLPV